MLLAVHKNITLQLQLESLVELKIEYRFYSQLGLYIPLDLYCQ
jgi:hypothetical protein